MKKQFKVFFLICSVLLTLSLFSSCISTEHSVTVDKDSSINEKVTNDVASLKRRVAIARFSNETQYAKGVFYDKENDPIGKQTLDILSTKLASTGKFILFERSDLELVVKENKIAGTELQNVAADYLIIGSVTQYGERTVGETSLVTQKKKQIAEAAVSIRLVEVKTGQVIYSEEGKGSAETTANKVLGLGASAGYDRTLSDKAISAAIESLVGNIVDTCMDRPWKSYILTFEGDTAIIGGGASQGISVGKKFNIAEKGKLVKNPQTGLMIELPGKKVGEVNVISVSGKGDSEYSVVEIISGKDIVTEKNYKNYEILEIQ